MWRKSSDIAIKSQSLRTYLGMICEVFEVCCRIITMATICASTNTNNARRVLYGLFGCQNGLVSQIV